MMLRSVSRNLLPNFYTRSQSKAYGIGIGIVRHKSSRSFESPTPVNPDDKAAAFEDVVHNILVNRAAPEWLPFRPGTSYWVPPRPSGGMGSLLNHLSDSLTAEEFHSLHSIVGYPPSQVVYMINPDSDDNASEDSEDTSTDEEKDDLVQER